MLYAAASNGNVGDPGANPNAGGLSAFNFTLPSSGRVYVRVSIAGLSLQCSAGSALVGLYIDSVPVPKTSIPIDSTIRPYELVGVSSSLAAGLHSVTMSKDCPGGSLVSDGAAGHPTFTVLLVVA